MKRCRHRSTRHMRWTGQAWELAARGINCAGWIAPSHGAVVCNDCGAWLSLGPATDTPETAIEMRAAEIAANASRGVGLGGHRPEHCTGKHGWHWFEEYEDDAGPCCYCGHDGPVLPGIDNECQAGYLAHAIAEHMEES